MSQNADYEATPHALTQLLSAAYLLEQDGHPAHAEAVRSHVAHVQEVLVLLVRGQERAFCDPITDIMQRVDEQEAIRRQAARINRSWAPNPECICPRCEVYYEDPDEFWDGPNAEANMRLRCHFDQIPHTPQ